MQIESFYLNSSFFVTIHNLYGGNPFIEVLADSELNFKTWKKLFVRGKTTAVYLAIINFVIFSVLVLMFRYNLVIFVICDIGDLASFGVLVDFVSHLFNDNWISPADHNGWMNRFASGRTHDTYGLILQISVSAMMCVRMPFILISTPFSLFQLYSVIKLRFFH